MFQTYFLLKITNKNPVYKKSSNKTLQLEIQPTTQQPIKMHNFIPKSIETKK